MQGKRSPQLVGVEVRHEPHCPAHSDTQRRCRCRPHYRGRVTQGRSLRLNGPWTRSLSEARSWRTQTLAKLDAGEAPRESRRTVAEAADDWLASARSGTIRNRSGKTYKPSALRTIEAALRLRVIPVWGRERLTAITRPRLQQWVRTLIEDGLSASSVRNTLIALRVLYRDALETGEVNVNPTVGLRLPALERHEPRFVPFETAAAMLEVLPIEDRAVWAVAFYAGLRRGELWGLRVGDVDRGEGIIRVRHGEDVMEGRIDPKSVSGFRPVPITDELAAVLDEYEARLPDRLGRAPREDDRYFPGERADRFSDSALAKRCRARWQAAGFEPVGLHDCRHTFASFGIAAGWNAKTLQTYMGHSSIQVTYDVYGHLFPGSEAEAASMLDAYFNARKSAVA